MKTYRIFFTLIILVACGYGCSNHIVEQDERQNVVLIFKDAPEQTSTMRFLGKLSVKGRGTVNYVDSSLTLVEYVPKKIGYDTITVPAFGGYAEILHTYQAIEDIPYLLMAGDTVLFTYGSDLRPRLISLVSERNTNVYNILWNDPRCVQPCGYSTKTTLSSVEYQRAFELWNKLDNSTPESIVKKIHQLYINLDSLRMEYDAYCKYIADKMDSKAVFDLPPVYVDYYKKVVFEEKDESFIKDLNSPKSDSLLHYVSNYIKLLDYPFDKSIQDPLYRFNMAIADSGISLMAKYIILRHLIKQIVFAGSPYPQDTVNQCLANYTTLTGDSLTFRSVPNTSDEMIVSDFSGMTFHFPKLMERFIGKVIYVDFWASWCSPCIQEIKSLLELENEYENSDVVFLSFSIDEDDNQWIKTASKYGLKSYSYRVLNRDSKFLKEIELAYVPRFLVFDKTGKLVNMNAPRPSSGNVMAILDMLLKDNVKQQ